MSINSNNTLLNEILSTIDDLPTSKEEQEKSITIVENGTTEVIPDEGKALSKVTVNVTIESDNTSEKALLSFEDYDEEGFPSTLRYNCPDEATLDSLFYNGNANSGVFSSKIKKVILPNYTTKISDKTFCGMSGIEELSNWDYIIHIGNQAFSRNNNIYDKGRGIQHIYFPPNLTYIGDSGFFRTAGKIETEIPDTVTYIGNQAFQYGGNSSKVLTKLPSNLTYIGDSAFAGYFIFEKLDIPATVDYIGTKAFDGGYHKTSLIEVKFRGTPTTLGNTAFNSNTALANIYVPWAEDNPLSANAPWGATNATIHYNTTYNADGNPTTAEV